MEKSYDKDLKLYMDIVNSLFFSFREGYLNINFNELLELQKRLAERLNIKLIYDTKFEGKK